MFIARAWALKAPLEELRADMARALAVTGGSAAT
jgi:hypothetical protein